MILFLLCMMFSCVTLNAQLSVVLMIPLYEESNTTRLNEFIGCLRKNLAHQAIQQIHILYDTTPSEHSKKNKHTILNSIKTLQVSNKKPIVITEINRRQTFKDFFELANMRYPGQMIIVAHADIYFDNTLLLLDGYDLSHKLVALTRWEILPQAISIYNYTYDGPLRSGLQDAWIFKTPIVVENTDIKVGLKGAAGNIAFEVEQNGLEVLNACFSIKAYHVHHSSVRHYDCDAAYDTTRFKELILDTLH